MPEAEHHFHNFLECQCPLLAVACITVRVLDRFSQGVSRSNPLGWLMSQLQTYGNVARRAQEECLPLCFPHLLSAGRLLEGRSCGCVKDSTRAFLWGSRAERGPAAEFGLRAVTLYVVLSIGDLVRTIGGGDTFL